MRRTVTNKDKFTYIKAIHKNNYSLTKSLRLTSASNTPCPIKPTENIIPKDLNLQKIFTNMLTSSNQLSKVYSSYINNHSYSTISLNFNHNNIRRKTILRKIRDFFLYYNINYKIYFKTILLYDIISLENENKKFLSSEEEIALGSLILSIKFNYDENKMFSMKKFLKVFEKKNYKLWEIIDIERKAIKSVNYFLNFTTPMCFLEFFLMNGIIYNIDYLNKSDYAKIYFEVENVLEKTMEESNIYLKYNFFYLACSVVSFCRKMFYLEKWPKMLKKVFSIDFYFFQSVYNHFFVQEKTSNEKNFNNNKVYSNKTYNSNNNKEDIVINGNNKVVLLNLENFGINNTSKNKRNNNIYNSYKKNYYKTIDKYNNIINININNVSFNNIYNNRTTINEDEKKSKNNSIEKSAIKSNKKSKRFHYKIDNSSIDFNSEAQKINDSIYNNRSTQNNVVTELTGENCEITNKNDYNLTTNLTEIKGNKDLAEQNTYSSPPKRKRKHYYIINNENKSNDKTSEKNVKDEDKKNSEIKVNNDNNEVYKNNKNYNEENKNEKSINTNVKNNNSRIRKIFTYTYDNSLKNMMISNNDKNSILKLSKNKYNKKEEKENNIINRNDNYNKKNINYTSNKEELNNHKYTKTNENILEQNDKIKSDIKKVKEEQKDQNLTEKKPNNLLITNYFNYTYYRTDKKSTEKKFNFKNRYNNINLTKIEKTNTSQNIEKNNININSSSIGKQESPKIRKTYRNFQKNLRNNLFKIVENNGNSLKNEQKNELTNKKDLYIPNNKKKHRGENKIKYNDLIKYKLSKCESINKRVNI